ncbi:MAG: ATPase [Rhodospirillales bacterium]|nr:ATPase [Alphaproteobacteria bacterium]USO03570.1 MAG: ATPase [Rhodospirillales bacterium]
MPITITEFNDISHKVITLMGMSGVGKTYLSTMLAGQGWKHYSCDYEIGTRYLGDEIVRTLSAARGESVQNEITAENLSMLSEYVGRLGDPRKGGLPLEEFKRRQQKYFEAECRSLSKLKEVVQQAHQDGFTSVVNDSTGSLCEIDDKTLLDSIDENSLIVYIKANAEEEKEVLKRAQDYPKPLFFSPERFDFWLEEYQSDRNIRDVEEMDPDDFSRWVFPRLFENRLPKYQRIADKYGTTIPSEAFQNIASEKEFLKVIVDHLED